MTLRRSDHARRHARQQPTAVTTKAACRPWTTKQGHMNVCGGPRICVLLVRVISLFLEDVLVEWFTYDFDNKILI